MKFLNDDSGSTGVIIALVLGLFIAGFFYISFGAIMNQIQLSNNDLISGSLPYSQDRHTAMDLIFKFWWSIPIYAVLLFGIWAIKQAIERRAGEI